MLRRTEHLRLISPRVALLHLLLLRSQTHILLLSAHVEGDKVADLSSCHVEEQEESERMGGETSLLTLERINATCLGGSGPGLRAEL
jgi:hypothetical protein